MEPILILLLLVLAAAGGGYIGAHYGSLKADVEARLKALEGKAEAEVKKIL
jgi:hypothetical protein